MIDYRYRNKDWLYEQYVEQERISKEIGNLCGVCRVTIQNWLNKFQIKKIRLYKDRGWLYHKYIVEKLSIHKIADICECDSITIWKWLQKYNVSMRSLSEASKFRSPPSEEVRRKISEGNRRKKTPLEVRKKISATMQNILLEEWTCFKRFEPYCEKFNFIKNEEVRNQYGRICVVSGISALQNGQRLDVDHTNENKMQGCNGIKWRLVPLTHKAHSKMNSLQNHLLLELLLLRNKNAEMSYEFERWS